MLALGQKLPTRDEDHFRFQISHADIFYDTKLLPDGAEVTTYLYKSMPRRYVICLYNYIVWEPTPENYNSVP